MKYLLAFLSAVIILSSCKDRKKEQSVIVVSKEDTIIVCKDLGIDYGDTSQRTSEFVDTLNSIAGKRRRPPTVVQPPPTVSTSCIFLDFDGGTISGTSWNILIPGSAAFNVAGSGLSIDEIQMVIDSVSFDFAPFNVIITTSESFYNSFEPTRKSKCYITETYQWYGAGAGGVSFINSFGASNNMCFVFSSLFSYSNKKIREASSHEAGHQLGLYHQSDYDSAGNFIREYSSGVGNWAPTMGYPYSKPGRWWIGTNAYGQIQNDSLIIKNKIGIK